MTSDFLTNLQAWHWAAFGIALMVIEIFVPGVIFLWMGIAAGIVAGLLFVLPDISWQVQLVSFSVLSIATVSMGGAWLFKHPLKTEDPLLNKRGEQYVGRILVLESPIRDGVGRVRVDDTLWRVCGDDCPGGSSVRVTSVDGTQLRVECLDG